MVEFLRQSESCGYKIARVNVIRITINVSIYFDFFTFINTRHDVDIFKLTGGDLSIYRKVYDT